IFYSTNGGESWSSQLSPTTNLIYSVHFTSQNSGWAVCSQGTLLHTTNGGITFVEEDLDELPSDFLLSQNYPNPFNPTTNFEFSIPTGRNKWISNFGLVSLKIFDILGREVATIVNEELPAGSYKYQWNAVGLASGIYFYQLKAGDFVSTKKLILMK
ncbi:MAG TPA: T9SS type A sorting domain-containing protein, partial [Ignavibacteriaceae bacterium]|nr:T9SS type A sorting domain-containing protein [Ignavibacteriaceae bacterium]